MKKLRLGRTDIEVSEICLGTMTFGEQNSLDDACAQMDYALAHGVNFWDTAEMYPVPPKPETQGRTEQMLGEWFKKTGRRQDVVLATKIAGPAQMAAHIRNGDTRFRAGHLEKAISASLARLNTDYIDLYQLHWPNRPFPHFGQNHAGKIDFTAVNTAEIEDNLRDILTAMGDIVAAGKVRYMGLSDDTAWGIMKYVGLSKDMNLPRVQSIQNEFSLLNRSDDPYVAEVCVREDVSYLPWSPLATGLLSGKYQNGVIPAGSRWDVENQLRSGFDSFRNTPMAHQAVTDYLAVAQKHHLNLTQRALKFIDQQSFATSTIIGATSMDQLKSNITAFDLTLSEDVLRDIDDVYHHYSIPY